MQACSQESQGGAVTVASEKTMTDLRAGAFMFSAFAAQKEPVESVDALGLPHARGS